MERNPVSLMDSVDALDLMKRSREKLSLYANSPRDREFLAKLWEQVLRHERALSRKIDASFATVDSDIAPEPKKELTVKPEKRKLPNWRKS